MGFRKIYEFFLAGAIYQAQWEKEISDNILKNRKGLLILLILSLPILAVSLSGAADFIGGKEAYGPSHYTPLVWIVSIVIGMCAGLISGCIGAGGGFVITPALMSAGVKGIMAVGTDTFHIFAKAIMGTVIHKKLGNVNVALAVAFVIGSIGGATLGGFINRWMFVKDPVLSDAYISTIYAIILGFLGFYSLYDFIATKRKAKIDETKSSGMTSLAISLQKIKFPPPIITFDQDFGGRQISWLYIALGGFVVGWIAATMGVGGGFITFPMFIYVFGVSTHTTVGTDLLQIIFTAGYTSIVQYAIYGFCFYTLAMGLLLGSLIGVQIGAITTKVVPGIYIRGFFAVAILAGFINRFFALPDKLRKLEILNWSKETCLILNEIGFYVFWILIGFFSLWVIISFLKNIKAVREEV